VHVDDRRTGQAQAGPVRRKGWSVLDGFRCHSPPPSGRGLPSMSVARPGMGTPESITGESGIKCRSKLATSAKSGLLARLCAPGNTLLLYVGRNRSLVAPHVVIVHRRGHAHREDPAARIPSSVADKESICDPDRSTCLVKRTAPLISAVTVQGVVFQCDPASRYAAPPRSAVFVYTRLFWQRGYSPRWHLRGHHHLPSPGSHRFGWLAERPCHRCYRVRRRCQPCWNSGTYGRASTRPPGYTARRLRSRPSSQRRRCRAP